jgi:hypothetical protein
MHPVILIPEVTATAVVITQDDPRHPDYINPEEEKENN